MGAWYDKNLPFGDTSETYRSAGAAVAGGVAAPELLRMLLYKAKKPKDFDDRMAAVVLSKGATALITHLLFKGKTASHDQDSKATNNHLANMLSIPFSLGWQGYKQHKEDKEEAKLRRIREILQARLNDRD